MFTPAANAALTEWQTQVATGTTAAVSWVAVDDFEPPAGSRVPMSIDISPITSGQYTLEFLVNAGHGGPNGALIGYRGVQALKFEQWQDTGVLGITDYGIADHSSDYSPPLNRPIHVVATTDGVDTVIYVDGALAYTFSGIPLNLSDIVGIGGTLNDDLTAYSDPLDGHVYGFAAYNSILPESEIAAHATAWQTAQPEPPALAAWQAAVTSEGTPPASTYFDIVSGLEPVIVNVGNLSGDRTFEFVVHSGVGGPSVALLGTGGVQGLKFDQWQDTGTLGITNYGVVDVDSGALAPSHRIAHVAYVSDDVSTTIYVDGEPVATVDDIPLQITGEAGLGGAATIPNQYSDHLDGTVLRFASYDVALTDDQIAARHAAFAADNGVGTFAAWQTAASVGATPAVVHLQPVSGSSPISLDVGALEGDRSFEFIVNAEHGNTTAILMGSRVGGAGDGLKFEQNPDTGVMGLTKFGVVDLVSDYTPPLGEDVHIVYVSDEIDTRLYVNGELVYTFEGEPLDQAAGEQGIAALLQDVGPPTFSDPLDGHILGFASYDAALTPAELAAHFAALFSGTTPPPPTADFRIQSISRNAQSGEITLTWNSTAGRTYGVFYSTDTATFPQAVNPSVPATGGETSLTFAPPVQGARLFLRVVENAP